MAKFQSTCSPGSGAYGLPTMLVTRKDYNKSGKSSVFQHPIAQAKEKEGPPAPNAYTVCKTASF